MQDITAIWLQSIDAFKQVPLDQLEWYIANSQIYSLEPEEILFKPNSPIIISAGGLVHNTVQRLLFTCGVQGYMKGVPMVIFVRPAVS